MTKYDVILKISFLKSELSKYKQDVHDAEVLLKAYTEMLDKMKQMEAEQ